MDIKLNIKGYVKLRHLGNIEKRDSINALLKEKKMFFNVLICEELVNKLKSDNNKDQEYLSNKYSLPIEIINEVLK